MCSLQSVGLQINKYLPISIQVYHSLQLFFIARIGKTPVMMILSVVLQGTYSKLTAAILGEACFLMRVYDHVPFRLLCI